MARPKNPYKTHGMTKTHEYRCWVKMHQRTTNSKHPRFKDYGGRGIKVCSLWTGPGGFEYFIAHIGPAPSPKHTIDRILNDVGYQAGNIRWATRKEQQNNMRSNRIIEFRGEKKNAKQWSEASGIPYGTLLTRIYRGWSLEDAFHGAFFQ